MSTPSSLPPAGWYPDPQGGDGQRWWNGVAWSSETRAAQPEAPVAPAEPVAPAQSATPAADPYQSAPQGYAGAQQQPYPGAQQQSYPAAQQPYPGAQQGYPGYPGAQQPYAGAQPGYAATPAQPVGIWRSPEDDRPVVRNLIDAIRTVFGKYATFTGRAGRAEYWWWILANYAVFLVLYIIGLVIVLAAAASINAGNTAGAGISIIGSVLFMLAGLWELALIIPTLAVLVRRLRDAGFAWGFVFLGLVPFGGLALLIMACMPSKFPER